MHLLPSALFIHLVFLSSVFEIYFPTQVTPVSRQHGGSLKPAARRLVLFLADGLDAQHLYSEIPENTNYPWFNPEYAPYLWTTLMQNAHWGTALKRGHKLPGYMQIMSGLQEDPSMLFKSLRHKKTNFDTVLNQSRQSWCWGTMDVLSTFAKEQPNIHMMIYERNTISFNENMKDFFDAWIISQIETFLKNAPAHPELYKSLHDNQIIFVIHMTGPDMWSKYYREHPGAYAHFIRAIDFTISHIVGHFDRFFKYDEQTAYLFTSDHGQLTTSAATPVIFWGLNDPKTVTPLQFNVQEPVSINQTDLTVFMATLLGSHIPKHNTGTLPREFLHLGTLELAEAYFENLKQLATHLAAWADRLQYVFLYQYRIDEMMDALNEQLFAIQMMINKQNFVQAVDMCKQVFTNIEPNMRYVQTIFSNYIMTAVIISMITWMVIVLEEVINFTILEFWVWQGYEYCDDFTPSLHATIGIVLGISYTKVGCLVLAMMIFSTIFVQVQNLPHTFLIYTLLPQALLYFILNRLDTWIMATIMFVQVSWFRFFRGICRVFYHLFAILLLIMTCFDRRIWASLTLMIMFRILRKKSYIPNGALTARWVVSGSFLAAYPFLPVLETTDRIYMLCISCMMWIVINGYLVSMTKIWEPISYESHIRGPGYGLAQIQMVVLICSSAHVVYLNLCPGQEFLVWNHVAIFMLIGLALFLPLYSSLYITKRYWHVCFGLAVPYIYLSSCYEPMFLLALAMNLYAWMEMEHLDVNKRKPNQRFGLGFYDSSKIHVYSYAEEDNPWRYIPIRKVGTKEFRMVYVCLYFLLIGFSAAGNSHSALFDASLWFETLLDGSGRFSLTQIMVVKAVIPMLVAIYAIRGLELIIRFSLKNIFLLGMLYCDIMAFILLFSVQNEGTWWEMEVSIGNYAFIQLFPFVVAVLYFVIANVVTIEGWEYEQREVVYVLQSAAKYK